MPQRVEERVPTITPRLAWRVAVMGGVAFALFGIVFFRLWFLQVLSGQDYVSQARENRVRKISIEAPRGDIVDRNGATLVRTTVSSVVQLDPNRLPPSVLAQADAYRRTLAAAEGVRVRAADRLDSLDAQLREQGRKPTRRERVQQRRLRRASNRAPHVAVPPLPASETALRRLYVRLGRVLGVRPASIHSRVIRGIAEAPYSDVTIRTAVPRPAFDYLRERQDEFPGVVVQKQYLRSYPHKTLAAQLFGTLGPVSKQELKRKRYKGVAPGDRVGQSGLEYSYDRYMRGKDGYEKVVINALGNRDDRRATAVRQPVQGQRLKLTLDLDLERAATQALARGIAAAGNGARAGAFVAMDPRDGSILALGSLPSFDANLFAKPISQKTYDYLTSQATGAPLLDRATASGYPTGSTFKPVTALAALSSGVITTGTVIVDDGSFKLGTQSYRNARGASYGALNITDALRVSSDIFFFDLGARAAQRGPVIQRWARRLGFGERTGIDVPGENPGLVPDRRWRDRGYDDYLQCAKRNHVTPGTTKALFTCGGIERPWSAGDNVNLAVGQGDLQATPLQLATAYAALENDGTVVRPHLGEALEDGLGRTVQEIHKPPRRHLHMDPTSRSAILTGLHEAATQHGGTSVDVFKGFPLNSELYGKTGTAERGLQPDQAWYACFVKDPSRPIVVVVTIERGGFGATTAAPVARLILSQWFHIHDNTFHAGASATL
jgi:penicillin-binding protein 2